MRAPRMRLVKNKSVKNIHITHGGTTGYMVLTIIFYVFLCVYRIRSICITLERCVMYYYDNVIPGSNTFV